MFTTDENRGVTAATFRWIAVGIAALSISTLIGAAAFRSWNGLDRSSDSLLAMATVCAFVGLVLGGAAGLYSWSLDRRRLSIVASGICLGTFALAFLLSLVAGGHW